MEQATLRKAQKKDSSHMGCLVDRASGYIFEFLLQELAGKQTYIEFLSNLIDKSSSKLCYQNSIIAEIDSSVAGLACAYPVSEHKLTLPENNPIAKERMLYFSQCYEILEPNSYFLYSIATYPQYEHLGVGSQLIARVKKDAQNKGFSKCSLQAWADNKNALTFYKKRGFNKVAEININPHPELNCCGKMLLLTCNI